MYTRSPLFELGNRVSLEKYENGISIIKPYSTDIVTLYEIESNEEILNEILDKINENGLESLQEDEKAFLKIYAKSH